MPQSHARIVLHITFSTKGRVPYLQDPKVRKELYQYIAGTLNKIGCTAIEINGVADHVHVLCNLSRTVAVAKLLETIKASSSAWVKKQGAEYETFSWQGGYGAFSVSPSKVAEARRYVQNQEAHHRRMTFQEEFRMICERHSIQIDERYVWD